MVEWTPTYRDGMSTYCRCVSHTHTLSPVTSRLSLSPSLRADQSEQEALGQTVSYEVLGDTGQVY